MTSYTPNLNLLKKDPSTDGNDTFNITTMLNDNWDKIDKFCLNNRALIQQGTYVGTGTYGEENPNELSFNFNPKIIIVISCSSKEVVQTIMLNGMTNSWVTGQGNLNNPSTSSAGFTRAALTISWENQKVVWFSSGSQYQLNEAENTFNYVAIG